MEPKGHANGVPVYCEYSEIVSLDKIEPNPKNDNIHPEYQIGLLGRMIEHHGWRAPITISTRSGLIVRGEGRYLAAKAKGWIEAPVDYQHYESEADELADLKADNRIVDFSRFDLEKEKELLQELIDSDFDLDLVGYTEDDLSALMEDIEIDQLFEEVQFTAETSGSAKDETRIKCPLCGGEFELEQTKKTRVKKKQPDQTAPVEV